jgi:hypothetical protein
MRKYAALEIKGLPQLQAGVPRTKRSRQPRLTGGTAPQPPTASGKKIATSGIAASVNPEEIEWSENEEELMLF